MNIQQLLSAAALSLLAALHGPAQNVVQVSGGGTALQSAVNSNPSGSTFIVAPGTYEGFSFQNRDATIIASSRATILGTLSLFAFAPPYPTLRLRGLDFVRTSTSGYPGTDNGRIIVRGNAVVHDCRCQSLEVSTSGAARVTAAISETRIVAPGGLFMSNVDAVITDTSIVGPTGGTRYGYTVPLPALDLRNTVLRAERITASGAVATLGPGDAISLTNGSIATIADSNLVPGATTPPWPPALSIRAFASTATVSPSSTIPGGVTSGSVTTAPLATAEWLTPGLNIGSTVTSRFTEAPNTAVAVILSWDFVRFDTPLVAETLFVFGSPNWFPLTGGISDAQGRLDVSVTLPNTPQLRYSDFRLTGLFGGTLPVRSTAPLGGIVR